MAVGLEIYGGFWKSRSHYQVPTRNMPQILMSCGNRGRVNRPRIMPGAACGSSTVISGNVPTLLNNTSIRVHFGLSILLTMLGYQIFYLHNLEQSLILVPLTIETKQGRRGWVSARDFPK